MAPCDEAHPRTRLESNGKDRIQSNQRVGTSRGLKAVSVWAMGTAVAVLTMIDVVLQKQLLYNNSHSHMYIFVFNTNCNGYDDIVTSISR